MAARLPATRLPVAWRGPLPALIYGLGLGAPARAWLEGRSVDGGPYRLTQERGQVVLVVLWSTACALCIETLSDLHSRCAIWQARPFAVVTLATDAQHEHVVATARRLPPAPDVTVLWRGARPPRRLRQPGAAAHRLLGRPRRPHRRALCRPPAGRGLGTHRDAAGLTPAVARPRRFGLLGSPHGTPLESDRHTHR